MKNMFLSLFAAVALATFPIAIHAGSGPAASAPAVETSVTAEAATFTIDPAHTTIGFRIKHMGIAFIEGEFDEYTGTIVYDPENVGATQADVTIQMASIDTDVERRDDHLRSADFFEVETHPTMSFKSTGVQRTGVNTFQLLGNLTIKGVTKPVVLDVTAAGPVGANENARVGFHATTTIDRRDFNINYGSDLLPSGFPSIGNEVQIVLDVEGVRS